MNGIEKITARIMADSDQEIAAIREKAAEETAKITASFQKEADTAVRAILDRGAVKAKEREEGLISLAQMETKKMILGAKQEMMDKAFDMAEDELVKMPEDKKIALLADLAQKASENGKEEIVLNSADRVKIGKAVTDAANAALTKSGKTAKLVLSEKTADIPGGLILKDNNVEVNCAFDTLIRLNKKEIAAEVAKVLFS